jgi:hypothetical protein
MGIKTPLPPFQASRGEFPVSEAKKATQAYTADASEALICISCLLIYLFFSLAVPVGLGGLSMWACRRLREASSYQIEKSNEESKPEEVGKNITDWPAVNKPM